MNAAPASQQSFNIYLEPEQARWLDSMEGVPVAEPQVESPGTRWIRSPHKLFERFGVLAPGLALALILTLLSGHLASWFGTSVLGFERSPVSPILVIILTGMLLRQAFGLPRIYEQGLRFCGKSLLRFGVILLGLRLSLPGLAVIGGQALPIVILAIASALLIVPWLGRLAGLPPRLTCLITVGSSICGVSAITATGPAIKASRQEMGYAVTVITVFGMLALFTYPLLAHLLFAGDQTMIGLFLGTAIHDTSQVAGAALMYQTQHEAHQALDVATTTKLLRNMFMGLVIPIAACWLARAPASQDAVEASSGPQGWQRFIPPFILAFIAMALLRSLGELGDRPFGLIQAGHWQIGLELADQLAFLCLGTAMAAVGFGINLSDLRSLGLRPFLIGLAAAGLIGLMAWASILGWSLLAA